MRSFTFLPRSSINSFWIVGKRYVVMPFLESWVPEMCSLMTVLYFARSFKVSRKFPRFLELESSRWPRKGRFCLLRNFMTATTLCRISLHRFFSLFIRSCISLSIVWWTWSLSASSFHLSKHCLWTFEFSWLEMHGLRCQKLTKDLQTKGEISFFD